MSGPDLHEMEEHNYPFNSQMPTSEFPIDENFIMDVTGYSYEPQPSFATHMQKQALSP